MSNCPLCYKQSRQRKYLSPNNEYFTIQTIIQTKSPREKHRQKHKHLKQHPIQIDSKKINSSRSIEVLHPTNKVDERRQIGRLKAKIDNYQGEIQALKKTNDRLRLEMQRMRSTSQLRTPRYPSKEQTSIGKIVKDRWKQIKTGKISLGSDKRTSEEMDQLLMASSQQNISKTQSSKLSSNPPSDDNQPTQKFTQLMLKLKKPCNQSQQRMIRDEALRVAGKIRQIKTPKQRLSEGLYYS